ncbi:YiiX/YebB-like N1pC/P60 family cysteine hydrolase [Methylocapsa sp. D3K7]|uniref:YiiX/YebB-like N1pC/P60 family cysteine hydrolase n=1 Tax=Methylocapsa sp. D3K7 TaxID=3041435 RepID=UPI00244EE698|nr:YiiX/YebB-like N1pC/P60 family cysteine hydrolase [Methylocapsa sp. D3K7]WGJ13949.1 YiiX/YebB-like N1pC/P60 family cysteine hydrolase [Methylocapsa sp. D3K7]
MNRILDTVSRRLAHFLSAPIKSYRPIVTCDPQCLAQVLHPGDILLVEGDSRISSAIRYLTQSTWSHAALYVGRIIDRHEPDGEPHVLVEAELEEGVISSPLSKYGLSHSRICRPVGLASEDIEAVISFAVERIGFIYDLKNIVDLVRYLLPTPPVPVRFRRRMIALGAGSPTRAICSTLIAQAFHSIRYPILPQIETAGDKLAKLQSEYARTEIFHIRNHRLFTPHDFDISPYFSVIKPMIEAGFDHRTLTWAEEESRIYLEESHHVGKRDARN